MLLLWFSFTVIEYRSIATINTIICLFSARPGTKKLIDIDPRHVHIKPEVIRFPGCFTLEIRNLRVSVVVENLSNIAITNTFFEILFMILADC